MVVYEKSRGLGGRGATRRIETVGFDHGAQYFTTEHPVFQRAVRAWHESGVIQRWQPRRAQVDGDGIEASPDGRERYVAVPGMSALGRHLAAGVAPLRRAATGWHLHSEDGSDLGQFNAVIVAAPAPQAAELLRHSAPALARRAAGVEYSPAWAVMAEAPTHEPVPYDGLFFATGALSWAARNNSKPQQARRCVSSRSIRTMNGKRRPEGCPRAQRSDA